jgi:hypothetical protein
MGWLDDAFSSAKNAVGGAFGANSAATKAAQGSQVTVPTAEQAAAMDKAPAEPWGGQQAYSMPGLQPGETQGQIQGIDLSQYGPMEQYYRDNQSSWTTPGQGETGAYGTVQSHANGNIPQGTNNSQEWFNQYKNNMPGIASDPGFGAYYDNAKTRAAESIDQAAAARGNYGSSAAIDQNARAFSDLEADRAKNEANYNLARLGEQRNWQSLGGQMAGAADANTLANSRDQQGWESFLSSLGLQADQLGLQRTNAGADAAGAAQSAERNRGSDYFNNELAIGDRMSGLIERSGNRALDNDMALLDQVLSGNISVQEATVNMDAEAKAQFMNDLNSAGQIYGTAKNL